MAEFQFVGPSYEARSKTFDAQRCVNLYPEISQSGSSKSVSALIGTPGLKLWNTLEGGPIRGMLVFDTRTAIVVAGNTVYSISNFGIVTNIGACAGEPNAPVSMAGNGVVVMLVTGYAGYTVMPGPMGSVTEIVSPGFTGADYVGFLDGFFVFNRPGTGEFGITGLYSTTIDPLDYATAEGSPDRLISLLVDHREVWLFGERTIEVWFNQGGTDFPLARIQGAFIEHGCAAKHSICKLDNSVFWLGADDKGSGMVFRAAGYSPQRISTHAIEYAIGQYSRIDDAIGIVYQQEGHSFYMLSFPIADKTWVYDASTGLWHERAYRDSKGALHRHRASSHMAFAGKNIIGDWETGNLYEFDLDTYTDNLDVIQRIRSCQHMDKDTKRVFVSAFQLDMEAGVGIAEGQGADPKAMLQWSNDGGYTWSNELWASLGKMGEKLTRVRWRRLGKARDRVFKVTITDPVKVCIVNASVEMGAGAT